MSDAGAGAIPFDAINAAALASLPTLCREWFPHGKLQGREFKVGNLHGDVGESLSINVTDGVWKDFEAQVGGSDPVSLYAAAFTRNDQGDAARKLGQQLGVYGATSNKATTKAKPRSADSWLPILPVPATAPKPQIELGACDRFYEYRDAEGRLQFYVRRWEARPGGKKRFLPLVYGTLGGKVGWHARHPDAPRPLYGLDRLAVSPDAPVIVCEGEKSADAAQFLFPGYVCITWPAGSSAVAQADWTPLERRNVIMWPDADAPGAKAAADVVGRLPRVRVLRVDDLPDGHDAADIMPDDPATWLAARLPREAEPIGDRGATLRALLSIDAWAERDIPEPDRLLGDLITTTTRVFLVGRTGLGKTLLGLAIAAGIASGNGFLHWRSARAARVLYLDGEMPAELIKPRARDAIRRLGDARIPPGNLLIFGRDIDDEARRACPGLPPFAPLNTADGQKFLMALIDAIGGIDLLICDNVMSLIAGDQKDEVPWSETLPLVQALTNSRIGQLWLDHTGHNSDRQYGSSTKAWRFDAVGCMAPLADGENDPRSTGFTLSFDHPGKARRRTPDNWAFPSYACRKCR